MDHKYLSIGQYLERERSALETLSVTQIQAFGSFGFNASGFPVRVLSEAEIVRYIDTMYGTSYRFYGAEDLVSPLEVQWLELIADISRAYSTQVSGKAVVPIGANLAGLRHYRLIKQLLSEWNADEPTVVDIGPGSGYFGALCLLGGIRYHAVENCMGLYLWQDRLYRAIAGDRFVQSAENSGNPASEHSSHTPWWRFAADDFSLPPKVDILFCNNALAEMSRMAISYILNTAKKNLSGGTPGMFVFDSVGQQTTCSLSDVLKEFAKQGFGLLDYQRGIFGFVTESNEFYDLCIPVDLLLAKSFRSKVSRMKLIADRKRKSKQAAFSQSLACPHKVTAGVRTVDFMKKYATMASPDYDFKRRAGIQTPIDLWD